MNVDNFLVFVEFMKQTNKSSGVRVSINLELPQWLWEALQERARLVDVAVESLIKIWLADKLFQVGHEQGM